MNESSSHQSVLEIDYPPSARRWRKVRPKGPVERLSLSGRTIFHQKLAAEICTWGSVREISIFHRMTRAALRQIFSKPDLQALYISSVDSHGSLKGLKPSLSLQSFRCGFGLTSADLRAISQSPNLTDLGSQFGSISVTALEAVVGIRSLRKLDLEGNVLIDEMTEVIGSSRGITDLDIGASRLSSAGLAQVCKMAQLQSLDIWATDIRDADLDMLQALPDLRYLTVGGYEGQTKLTAKGVLPRLAELSSLKRLWLDGIEVTEQDRQELARRFDQVRIT